MPVPHAPLARRRVAKIASFVLAVGVGSLVAQNAHAAQIICGSPVAESGSEALPTTISLDTDTGVLSSNGQAPALNKFYQLKADTRPSVLSIVGADGVSVAQIEVLGHALNPQVSLIAATSLDAGINALASKISCVVTGDAEPLFEKTITDPVILHAIADWKAWTAKRPKVCDPFFDSIGYFQPGAAGKIALVLHGYSSNPRRMQPIIHLLLDRGYNVIAPRLARHFNTNLRDLDHVKAVEWIQDAENTLKLANAFGPQVTTVGYSMGGALVSRLLLEHADVIDRAVLIAPAWRVTQSVSWGSLIGSAPVLVGRDSYSYQDYMKIPITCSADAGYTSPQGGLQVQEVAFDTDRTFDHGKIGPLPNVYNRIRVPFVVFSTPGDTVINSSVIDSVCHVDDLYCTHVNIPDREHTNITDAVNAPADGDFAGLSMGAITQYFLSMPIDDPMTSHVIDPRLVMP